MGCCDDVTQANSSTLKTYIDRKDITHTDASGEGPVYQKIRVLVYTARTLNAIV